MFLYFACWAMFVCTTLLPVLLVVDYHLNVKKDPFQMAAFRVLGFWGLYDKKMIFGALAAWIASGWYLFG